MREEDIEYINIPIYLEKVIKKLNKTQSLERELKQQIYDYLESHGIAKNTPLSHLKYFPKEEVDPNQLQLNFNNKNDSKGGEESGNCK